MKTRNARGRQLILATLCIIQLLAACNENAHPQQRFKDESAYFMALRAADARDEKTAMRLFTEGRKSENSIVSRKCAEALTQLGNVRERIEACKYLLANWNDEAALITVCTELEKSEEYSLIITYTDSIDVASANNELVRLRLTALYEKKDSRFEAEAYQWMLNRALSASHLDVYKKCIEPFFKEEPLLPPAEQNADEGAAVESPQASDVAEAQDAASEPSAIVSDYTLRLAKRRLIGFRTLAYHRSYSFAYEQIDDIQSLCEDAQLAIPRLIVSDMGKAALYGTVDHYGAARLFDRLSKKLSDANNTDALFYAYFYAGRLYDKAAHYPTLAMNRFKSALEASVSGDQYDNALWYMLNMQIRASTDDILETLKTYSGTWHDSAYFDDFFESLSVLLISHHQWQDFYDVWKVIDKTASEEAACKYAYLSGRLVEEGLAKDNNEQPTRLAVTAFSRVLSGGASLYYKVCALERMNILDADVIESALCAANTSAPEALNREAENFLAACAGFGFPQRIYSEWLQYRDVIGTESRLQMSQFLSQCGQYDAGYNVQSLRIASRAKEYAYERIPRALLALDFPRFYDEFVTKSAEEHGLEESLLYALIRSESFFDPSAASYSGAQGLTQLMQSTADDVARKLKVEDYNLLDPETNIRFGAYYLSELMGRVDDLPLLAIFAYNAGLTNVRRWVRQTKGEWLMSYRSRNKATGISPDLFLETLPFTETREYGRKIVSAAALYAWLYYGINPGDTVRALM